MTGTSKNSPRIAVIAVHGVADQQPHQTARQAAGLLLGEHLDVDYEAFKEEDVHIGLRSVELHNRLEIEQDKFWNFPPIQSSAVSQSVYARQSIRYTNGQSTDPATLTDEQLEHESMREQLQEYCPQPEDSMLKTIVLTAKRHSDESGQPEPVVDIYENYWADLSRLKNGYFTVFFEFYLFLFFFSRIGGIAVERAAAHFKQARIWRKLQKFHWISEIAIVLGVPITHLALLSMASSGAPYLIEKMFSASAIATFFLTTVALLSAVPAILLGYTKGCKINARWWPWIFLAVMIVTALAVKLALPYAHDYRALVLALWVLLAIAILGLCKLYDSRRPGAFLLAVLCMVIIGITYCYFIIKADGSNMDSVFLQGVQATKWLVNLNVLMWLIFAIGTTLSSILGFMASYKSHPDERVISRQTAWTQALSLVVPGFLILLITFSLWQALLVMSGKLIDKQVLMPLQDLIDQLIFPHLSLCLALLGVGILFAAWMIFPAPLCESENGNRANNAHWVGEILTNAYDKMRWVGELFRFLLLIVFPLEWLYLITMGIDMDTIQAQRNIILYGGMGVVVLIFGSKGPLEFIAMGFRSGLDTALDVANWLRFRPRKTNPRGAICRRYVSILRYIAQWRDPQTQKGYDGVVIIAHSQGTVITSDLLRFLKTEYANQTVRLKDAAIARYFDADDPLSIRLLTFGCPLRQLYNRRFPVQYRWSGIRPPVGNGGHNQGPDPESLGLSQWSNLYCSGDYVGRYLWYADDDPHIWQPQWHGTSKAREKCLGTGGHTKYWSGGLPEVAVELDRLICSSAIDDDCEVNEQKDVNYFTEKCKALC